MTATRSSMITDAGTLVRTRVSEISIVGRNTQGVILIRTAEDENVVGLQRVAEPVDEEDLDTIDGSAAEGDDEIAPEVDVDDEPRRRIILFLHAKRELSPLFELKSPGCKVWAFVVLGHGKVWLCP
ncbi:DNA gyrase C-terminal beta-propeller domain-containing protein [Escherichia coli]